MKQRGDNVIGSYNHKPAELQPYNPIYPDVAQYVADLIRAKLDCVEVEHIGSTAIEGCDGKGIIDLTVLYPREFLEKIKDALSLLGFQHQPHKDPFPENRPMRVGSIDYKGRLFQIHVHVIQQGDAEAISTLKFRDILSKDKQLKDRYIQLKRQIIKDGTIDSLDYCKAKSSFIEKVI
ncbi:MAG: GrpB family protein [Sedimentisphaerales bacterium]|jgi:GrpB-like predicted nucleotidyltransferase (UPF0157 family)